MNARLLKNLFASSNHMAMSLAIGLFWMYVCSLSQAQAPSITSDGTLGTQITPGPHYTISGGTLRGSNQFHSFGSFNIYRGESATFTGPSVIDNIIGRVTGGSQSYIDGLLRSEINGADLYLLNPSGVLFGKNAQLDLSGSFHVSTADYLRLGSNGIFYAAVAENSVLTVDPPSAFGFLSGNPTGITLEESVLEVPENETLSIIGGDIQIKGGQLKAPAGKINLASVKSSGEIHFTPAKQDNDLSVDGFDRLGEIHLSQGATVDTSGSGAGGVVIRGGRLMMTDGHVSSDALGDSDADPTGIDIQIRDNAVLSDGASITADTSSGADAGDINIKAKNLQITGDAKVLSTAHSGSTGDTGDVAIEASTLDMSGGGLGTLSSGSGEAGNVTIEAETVALKDGAQISAKSEGSGQGGAVQLDAHEAVTISGQDSGISTKNGSALEGKDITITAETVSLSDGAEISSTSSGIGKAGNVIFNVDRFYSNAEDHIVNPSQVQILSIPWGNNHEGNCGDVIIRGRNAPTDASSLPTIVSIADTIIDTDSINDRISGGAVSIGASESLTLTDTEITKSGSRGNITLTAPNLSITDSALRIAKWGGGGAGKITLDAEGGTVTLVGTNPPHMRRTIIYARIGQYARDPGAPEVEIKANKVTLRNAAISAENWSGAQKGTDTPLDQVTNGGNITVSAGIIELDGGEINAQTLGPGKGVNIRLNAKEISLKNKSLINTRSLTFFFYWTVFRISP